MRTFLIALMIALLPLRGLVGDVMAMGQAMPTTEQGLQDSRPADAEPASSAATGQVDTAVSAMTGHGPCPDQMSASADAGHTSHGDTCKACDVCHQATLADSAILSLPAAGPGFAPASAEQTFVSANAADSFKPPIL